MDQPPPLDENQRRQRAVLLGYAGLGAELAGGILGFLLLGWLIGRAFGAGRTGMIVGAAIGCAGGLYNLIRRAYLMQKQESDLRRASGKPPPRSDEGYPADDAAGEPENELQRLRKELRRAEEELRRATRDERTKPNEPS